jgi:hypothetical protein
MHAPTSVVAILSVYVAPIGVIVADLINEPITVPVLGAYRGEITVFVGVIAYLRRAGKSGRITVVAIIARG